MYDVTSIQNLKKDVLYFVAKASFEGTLEEERDLIPEKMIEGPEPTFRCCIYKEREIVRQRIRLAEGKAPGAEDDGNIVQVSLDIDFEKLYYEHKCRRNNDRIDTF